MAAPLYAHVMQDTIAEGDLAKMQEVARQAEALLNDQGDVARLYDILKVEIAKLERQQAS